MICKQLADSNKLRPTLGVLEEHIKHVRVWWQVTIIQQQPFNLLKFGYYKDDVVRYLQSLRQFFLHHRPSSSSSDGAVKPIATSTFLQGNTQSSTWIPHSDTLQMPQPSESIMPHHIRHTLHTQKSTLRFLSFSDTPHIHLTSSFPSPPNFADLLSLLTRFQSHMSIHSGHKPISYVG